MKKSFLSMLMLATIVSCTQTDDDLMLNTVDLSNNSLSTRSIALSEIDSVALRDSVYKEFFVTYSDAMIYASIHCDEEGIGLDTIVPLTDGSDTLMYLIQYYNGWDVIAADKRGPLVVAMSEDGDFSLTDTLPGFRTYLDAQKLYLKSMRYVAENNSNSDAFLFWSMLHPQSMPSTRTRGSGYWEMYDSDSETITESSGHMIQTKWGQGEPWDTFVPYDSDRLGMKCAVGCAAVAGAQMLYYLHYKLGRPQMMCTTGDCVGDNKNYTFSFSNPSPEAWGNMALTQWDYSTERKKQSALLMAFVGCVINMNYDEESGTSMANLNNLFSELDISSTLADYNSTTAWNSLRNGMPIIIGADRKVNNSYKGHAWIMDGWKTVTTERTFYYGWVDSTWQDFKPNLDPIAPAAIIPDDMIKYKDFKTETSTYVTKSVLMNWGWDGAGDHIYCTLDGAWEPSAGINYQYRRKMIHGFMLK